jgi:predicted transposase/invertase (TIGR01784 family)
VLREFLLKNRNEVRRVLLTEYNAKHQRKLDRRDAWEDGREQGREEGREEDRKQIILKMYYKGYTLEQIADITDKQVEEVRTIIENNP